ncbi:MAG TPA: hypothetical protein DCR40_00965 [Prolixibacteraceae bacterium]|nr:hypothetical protein [Prolixibacteraceae bacterium]
MKKQKQTELIFDYKFEVIKRVNIKIDNLVDFIDPTDKTLIDVIKKYIIRYKSDFFKINYRYEVDLFEIYDEQIISTIKVKKYDYDDFKNNSEYKDHKEKIIDNLEKYSIDDFTFEDLKMLKYNIDNNHPTDDSELPF